MKNVKRTYISSSIIIICCILFALPEELSAQHRDRAFRFLNRLDHDERPYHFGFTLGVNSQNFALRPVEGMFEDPEFGFEYVLPEKDYGFHIGIVSNLNLTPHMDLRFIPTITFGDRYLEYYMPAPTGGQVNGGNGLSDWESGRPSEKQDLELTLLEFPLHLKFKSARMNNTRAYVIGGVKYTHDLASIELGIGDEILARVARNDLHYEFGVGLDHYFFYFKFSAEVKASFGLTNLIRPGEVGPEFQKYYNSIDRLNSRSIMISFTFE